jgi:UDP-2,3-diacylglucosamine pyrophosphatase LpxH
MYLSFDLISDLHLETRDGFDWNGQPTSQCCVVAGDISKDIDDVVSCLKHLSECYKKVIYIDGNAEHRWKYADLGSSYQTLAENLQNIPNVIFLQDNMVIINGVAIIGTNGWWSYDFDPSLEFEDSVEYAVNRYDITIGDAMTLRSMAINDANYLANTISRCQTMPDIRKIVVVTHTVPQEQIVAHDNNFNNDHQFNLLGNSYIKQVLEQDTERKIDTWCFGHYHNDVDSVINNIRYVNNCFGEKNSNWDKKVYYPKRIEVTF